MKGLDEMLEGFDEKGFEEWRMEKDKRKKLLSEKEVMDAIAQEAAEAANAVFEEESRSVAVLRAVIKMNGLLEKLFREEESAEKPAEKTELSALEELLFERTHLAEVRYEEGHSEAQLARCLELCGLVGDAGLVDRYYAWKEEKGL